MNSILTKRRKELLTQAIYAIGGSLMFAIAVNQLIIPLNLYNGGFTGISQLISLFLKEKLHLPLPAGMDMTGAIFFTLNIPLFYMGYRVLGKKFALKTVVTVTMQSAFLLLVPIARTPVIEDYLTSCIIGGIIAGIGVGFVLRGRTSGGGQDIIGLCCAKLYPNISVGQINIIINIMVYAICLLLFDVEIVVYSLIYTTVQAVAIDRVHIQNINMSVMIFTKKLGISKAIMEQTGRGVTNWDGEGAYTKKTSYILFVLVSKYEVAQIKQIVKNIDPEAFMIFTEGCSVDGNFEKRL